MAKDRGSIIDDDKQGFFFFSPSLLVEKVHRNHIQHLMKKKKIGIPELFFLPNFFFYNVLTTFNPIKP